MAGLSPTLDRSEMAVPVAIITNLEFVKPSASADCSLKDGEEHNSQISSKVSMSKEDLISAHPQTKPVWKRRLEIILLSCIILAISVPFITPTILYALPPISAIEMVS